MHPKEKKLPEHPSEAKPNFIEEYFLQTYMTDCPQVMNRHKTVELVQKLKAIRTLLRKDCMKIPSYLVLIIISRKRACAGDTENQIA